MKRKIMLWMLLTAVFLTACHRGELVEETETATAIVEPAITMETILVSESMATAILETTVPETEPPIFGEDITFTGTYVAGDDLMPYALFAPSSVEAEEEIPLIVFLHGLGECGAEESWFMNVGMPQAMKEWSMAGFRAYVICPHLNGRWNTGYWYCREASGYVMELLEYFTDTYAVDEDKIFMVGFSAGGLGAIYMVNEYPDYFGKMVVMSSPDPAPGTMEMITIPTVGCSETEVSNYSFMKAGFPVVFGENSVRYYDVKHGQVPQAAFQDDRDGNNCSDLVEWMLSDDAGIDGANYGDNPG